MIYVDTSALVPVFIREPKSEAVIAWLESSGERLAISEWSLVEFASAAAIKVRTGEAAANLAKQATARVREFADKHCTVAVPGREEFRRAAERSEEHTSELQSRSDLVCRLLLDTK